MVSSREPSLQIFIQVGKTGARRGEVGGLRPEVGGLGPEGTHSGLFLLKHVISIFPTLNEEEPKGRPSKRSSFGFWFLIVLYGGTHKPGRDGDRK